MRIFYCFWKTIFVRDKIENLSLLLKKNYSPIRFENNSIHVQYTFKGKLVN